MSKKAILIGATVVVIGGGVGLYFAGKTMLEKRIEEEITKLEKKLGDDVKLEYSTSVNVFSRTVSFSDISVKEKAEDKLVLNVDEAVFGPIEYSAVSVPEKFNIKIRGIKPVIDPANLPPVPMGGVDLQKQKGDIDIAYQFRGDNLDFSFKINATELLSAKIAATVKGISLSEAAELAKNGKEPSEEQIAKLSLQTIQLDIKNEGKFPSVDKIFEGQAAMAQMALSAAQEKIDGFAGLVFSNQQQQQEASSAIIGFLKDPKHLQFSARPDNGIMMSEIQNFNPGLLQKLNVKVQTIAN